jgi:hypothetical protein
MKTLVLWLLSKFEREDDGYPLTNEHMRRFLQRSEPTGPRLRNGLFTTYFEECL